jgi:hypothetical protein
MRGHMIDTVKNTGIMQAFGVKPSEKQSEDDKYLKILQLIYNMKLFLCNIRKL